MIAGELRPFFSYFGGKWTLAPHYPAPCVGDRIVEPFAGSAGYATRYPDREVILLEKAPLIASLWRWLINVSVDEVLGLPLDASDTGHLPQEAQWLIGFWCARGRCRPARTLGSSWMKSGAWPSSFWGERVRSRIARQVTAIRHWQIIDGDYSNAPDIDATWFVDPPYVGARHYLARVDSFSALGDWCRARRGAVIVCEQSGADWLPFVPFRQAKSISRGRYDEVIYSRERPTS